jgi:hypothetical protein
MIMASKIKIAKWCCVALAVLQLPAAAPIWASKQIDPEGQPFKSTLQRTWDAMDRTPPGLDTVIPRFQVTEETIPSAVVRLANEQGVLCGLYLVPWPEAQPGTLEPFDSVSATFQDATVAQVLDGLVALEPRFTWWEEGGVINVALASTVRDPTHPLNVRLPLFAADEVPYLLALFGGGEFRERVTPAPLFEEVYLTTGLLVGFGYSGPRLELHPPVTLTGEGCTAVEILNEMARQLKLAWCIVDRRPLGGQDIGFSMGVELVPLPSGQPIAQPPGRQPVRASSQETRGPCSTRTGRQAVSSPAGGGREAESLSSALVPLRERLVAEGFSLVWDPAGQEVLARKGGTLLRITANSRCACLNNVLLTLPQESVLVEGRLYVPAWLLDLTLSAAHRVASAPGPGSS